MSKIKKIILIITFLVATVSFAQKMKVNDGNIKNLKGISQFDLVFDYSNLQIPKFKSEEAFLEEKMTMREEKEKGSREKFRKSWFSDRESKYEVKFVESFNKRFKDAKVKVSKENDSEYVMHIHTTKLYAGYNVGVWRHNAEISATITVYKKDNPNKIVLKGLYKDVQGLGSMGYDFNSGDRIAECYAKLAKNIAYYIKKKAK